MQLSPNDNYVMKSSGALVIVTWLLASVFSIAFAAPLFEKTQGSVKLVDGSWRVGRQDLNSECTSCRRKGKGCLQNCEGSDNDLSFGKLPAVARSIEALAISASSFAASDCVSCRIKRTRCPTQCEQSTCVPKWAHCSGPKNAHGTSLCCDGWQCVDPSITGFNGKRCEPR